MNTEPSPAHFSLNPTPLKQLGMLNPLSRQALELYDAHGLSTQDRLFFCLWNNNQLSAGIFRPGDKLSVKGEQMSSAHVVVSGDMQASDGQKNFTLGPGSVIGLAEGMANLPCQFTVTATSTVNTRIIPIDKAQRELMRINAGLRGICRSAIARTLSLREIPENLK